VESFGSVQPRAATWRLTLTMLSTSTAYCPLANKVEYIDRGLLGMHAQVLLPSAFTVEEGALPPNTWFLAE